MMGEMMKYRFAGSARGMVRAVIAIGAALALSACATIELQPPQTGLEAPAAWTPTPDGVVAQWPTADWWRLFGSSELIELIDEARANSPDLAAAYSRILQAEAQARVAGASLLPTLDLGADASRQGQIGSGAANAFGLSLGASYEVDLWGRNRMNDAAARAQIRASRYDQETVALTLTAGVASGYLQVLSLRERLRISRLNLELAEEVLALVEARARFGSASSLELAQQRAAVASQRAGIPALEQQERAARAALAVLLGRMPQNFDVRGQDLDLAVPEVAPGLPSELLQRRPDIRRTEMQLAIAEADIAIARAALFPSLRLTGSMGLRSGTLSGLFSQDPTYGIAAALAMPIFNGGRLRAGQELAQARYEELLQGYRSAILTAFADADVSLTEIDALRVQAGYQDASLEQAVIALRLAEARYRAGAEGLLTVIDAQRTLYQARDQQAQLRLQRLQAAITLFRALGGGWEEGQSIAQVPET